MTSLTKVIGGGVVWGLLAVAQIASAVEVQISVANLLPSGSTAFSPFTVAAHNGSYDAFDSGAMAEMGIEDIAELGDGTALVSAVTAAQPTAVTGTIIATSGGFGPGIFQPGASGSLVLSLDPSIHRYLTYGAMVVPSNDAFVGNDSPTAIELFDAAGNFVATDLVLTTNGIWDAGTEVNQLFGAAYIVGQDAMLGTDENGVVTMADLGTQFSSYLGSDVPSGGMFTLAPAVDAQLASISFQVVPEPSALTLVGLGLVSMLAWGRTRNSRRTR